MMAASRALLNKARALTVAQVEEAIDAPFKTWALQCHAISIAIVKSDLFDYARVARGWCNGVGGQHSWVVLHEDPYDPDAVIVDPTLWSYDKTVEGIWVGTYTKGRHKPHGSGNIYAWGKPTTYGDEPVTLTPRTPLSASAQRFLAAIGPLDRKGWMNLVSNAPVQGWPAREIIEAVLDTPQIAGFVPIDRVGMLTERNPSGLYLKGDANE